MGGEHFNMGETVLERPWISKRLFAAVLVLCIVGAFCLGSFVDNFAFSILWGHKTPKVMGNVYVTIESPMGVYDALEGNVITDIGENATRYGVCNVAVNVNYIAVGNSTVAQTKTKLDTEYTRSAADSRVFWISSGDYAFNITKKFTFAGTVTLNAAAAHWSATANANDAYALAAITQTTFQSGWNLTIMWVFIYDAN
jgi:hypothetical protein